MAATLTLNGLTTPAVAGRSLFDLAASVGVRVPTSCQTNGKCKECVVEVTGGAEWLSLPTPAEAHLTRPFRLSCQCSILAESGHVTAHTMRRGRMRIERRAATSAPANTFDFDPAVRRDGDRILIEGQEIARSRAPIHGLAVDLGTTTVVLRLFNLETGEEIGDASFENPQRFGGSDVMSRIRYDTDHPGKVLRRTLAGYLSHAIQDFPVDPATIYDVVVVGNSTMRDLFFRQSVYSIGQTPYQSITEIQKAEGLRGSTALFETGRRCLLPVHPRARVYGGPIISGHVGADAAACMLAINLEYEDRLVAVMDIGTNTELIVGNRHRAVAASCPAGPAFEGGSITCGMPALDGAIEGVVIDDDGRAVVEVVGGGPAEGICGSGLIAALSELRRTDRMNEMGRFTDGSERFDFGGPGGVYLHERDINELAQAKGANVAGLRVVASHLGARLEDIEVFYLAGGFGRHIDVDAAKRIGLIPNLPNDRIVRLGNAAIEGASAMLLSLTQRILLECTAARVEHCRLEAHPNFFDFFVFGCQFTPMDAATEVAD